MGSLFILYGAIVVIAAALAATVIWASRPLWVKSLAIALATLLMPIAYAGYAELLGRPKPVSAESIADQGDEIFVVAAEMDEPRAIYLWLRFRGTRAPRAYALPWNIETAKQLRRALQQAEAQGTAVRMRGVSQPDRDTQAPLFYPAPHPALPPKQPSSS